MLHNALENLAPRYDLVERPSCRARDVHVLNEAQLGSPLACVFEQIDDLIVVFSAYDDRVDFEMLETSTMCGGNPGDHFRECILPSECRKALRVESIKTDRQSVQTGLVK